MGTCRAAFETGAYADEGVCVWCDLDEGHEGLHIGALIDGFRSARVEWAEDR